MAQRIIDPGNATAAVDQISISVLPTKTREFGFVPDLAKCMPGDLVLFRDAAPSRASQLIARAQSGAEFASEHSAWIHAEIFLYEDFVVEAVPRHGVRTRTLYSDIPQRILRVRRKSGLADTDRYQIALRALRMLGTRYATISAFKMGLRMAKGLWDANGSFESQSSIICSKVYFDAYADITRAFLRNCPVGDAVLPAHLSATPDLEDVEVGWLQLT